MLNLETFKTIENFANMYHKGNIKRAIDYMDTSKDSLSDNEKEALYHYKEWNQRINSWLEYIK
jgi:hypothetical protein